MPTCELCPKNAYYGTETPTRCREHQTSEMRNLVSKLCAHEGCTSTSHAFGYPGQKGTHCKKHAPFGMINVANPLCEAPECTSTSRAFDFPGGEGRFCKAHATSTMVNVSSVRCVYAGCNVMSRNFDMPGGKGRFCQHHREKGMVDVRNHTCIHPGCTTRAGFSIKGKPAQYCAKHKLTGMINYRSCSHDGCEKYPSYNEPGTSSGRFCAAHKLDGMVNVRMRMCQAPGCPKWASFGTSTPQFCKAHAEDGMHNLLARYCQHPGCEIQAAYNVPGRRPRFCQTHAEPGMDLVVGKGCQYPGCTCRSRNFDVPGGKGRFCTKHKEPGMVDVQNPKCEECGSLASYGIPGGKPSRCSRHRLAGMLSRPRAKCVVCRKPAFYGTQFIAKHCETHKTNDDDNLMERECVSCHLVMVLDKNNKCEYCDKTRFETNRLAKQNALMEYLDRKGLRGNSTDIVIDHGVCGKERPDRIFEYDDKVVILECDEHQHRDRPCECEQTRMVNIAQSFGGMPVYFVRWNPDMYIPGDNRSPESVVRRHHCVARFLQDIANGVVPLPNALASVIYLYYDGWTTLADTRWETILAFD